MRIRDRVRSSAEAPGHGCCRSSTPSYSEAPQVLVEQAEMDLISEGPPSVNAKASSMG